MNLPFHGAEVTELVALDPSEELLAMARGKRALVGFPVAFLPASAEAIPLDSRSIDTVVSNPDAVLDPGRVVRARRSAPPECGLRSPARPRRAR